MALNDYGIPSKVDIETANAQEEYNLRVLAEQARLLSELKLPDTDPER